MTQVVSKTRHVLVIGGTGFLGYHIVRALLAQGDAVSVLCRNPAALPDLFPAAGVTGVAGDVDILETADYLALLAGIDAVVFAAGVDERCKPEGDAEAFFERANVWPVEQLFAAVAKAGVPRAVLLNSVFAGFDRAHPDWRLAARHPYIRSRVRQHEAAQAAVAGSGCVLVTVEVPWVFGSSPHRDSQWQTLVTYCRAAVPLMGIHGGASMMSVQTLAQAVCGALQWPQYSGAIAVGDENLLFVGLISRVAALAGRVDSDVTLLSDEFFRDLTALGNAFGEVFGSQGGLDLRYMADVLLQDLYIDADAARAQLHYTGGDLQQALAETVADVPESALLRGWRQTLNWFDPKHWRKA